MESYLVNIKYDNAEKIQKTDKITKLRYGYISLFIFSLLTFSMLWKITKVKPKDTLFLATSILITMTISIMSLSWILLITYKNDKDEPTTIQTLLDFKNINTKSVGVGMTQGTVFGFIDNFGMALGLVGLEIFLKQMKASSTVVAGISNLYSSIFGSVMGACLQKAIEQSVPTENIPWWSNLIGIIVGSLSGMFVGDFVMPTKQ